MDEKHEYSLHYEFSKAISESDQTSVDSLMKNILLRGNSFDTKEQMGIINIATGATLHKEDPDLFLTCISLGKAGRDQF